MQSASLETNVQSLLNLTRPPVAIGFFGSPPPGVPPWDGGPVAAGCVFWKQAQEGRLFYTVPSDHYNCAVGAYTHHIQLPESRAGELEQTLNFMVQNHYVAMEEVPGIPTLSQSPAIIVYGPLERVDFIPDLVIVAAQPAQAMLLYEAAIKAGAGGALLNTLGRPACAVLPLAHNTQSAALSLGCKGNRTFTGLPDSEMYLCLPGKKWEQVAAAVAHAQAANQVMGDYYRQRQTQFTQEDPGRG